MQHLHHMISALLVTIAIFVVGAFPARKLTYEEFKQVALSPSTYPELVEKEQVLSGATLGSLKNTLGFNEDADIVDSLAGVLAGLSRQPPNGKIDYQLATYFFSELGTFAPSLLKDVKTVGLMIMAEKRLLAEESSVDYDSLFRHAAAFYYGPDNANKHSQVFFSIQEWIHKAMGGDLEAAKFIVNHLAGQYSREFEKLKGVNRDDVVGKVLKEVQHYVNASVKPFMEEAKNSSGKFLRSF